MYENPFGYVWVPRGMGADWMPYTYGRWTWLPMAGWSWLPYEPWGWSTYHYGRWHWGLNLGWYWIPMSGWGPGWVNWWWDDDYYGWAPMSYWGYPGVIIDNFYYGRGWRDYRDYPWNSRALTIIRKDQLMARDVRSVALKNDAVRSIGKMSLGDRSPQIRPSSSPRISTESLGGGGRVILRKGGDSGETSTSGRGTGQVNPRGRDTTQTTTAGGDRKIDPKATSSNGGSKVEPQKKGESAPPAKSTPPPERRIRKKIGEDGGTVAGVAGRSDVLGYPSRMANPQGSASRSGARTDSGSVLDRVYRSITGSGGTTSSRGTVSRGSSSSGSSSSSAPRSMPRISSSGSSSSRTSTSSSGHSSSGSSSSGHSSGGSVHKK
jgi:hypothetical protein